MADKLIKMHRSGRCSLTKMGEHNCDCDYFAEYRDWQEHGKRKRVTLDTANKRLAEQRLRDLLRDPAARTSGPLRITKALAWAEEIQKKPRSAATLRNRIKQVMKVWGDRDLRTITRADLKKFVEYQRGRVTHLGKPPTEETIKYYIDSLQVLINVARDYHDVAGLPNLSKKRPHLELRAQHERARTRILSVEEVQALLDAYEYGTGGRSKPRPHRREWIALALYTGARKETVHKIRPEHVVTRQTAKGPYTYIRVPGKKSVASDRVIPFHRDLRELLSLEQLALPVRSWPKPDIPYVCKKIGIPKATAHDLRRTFCSWMLIAGNPPATVAKMMGHEGIQMVQDVYSHLFPEQEIAAIESLPSVFNFDNAEEILNEPEESEDRSAPCRPRKKINARRAHGARPPAMASRRIHFIDGAGRNGSPTQAGIRQGPEL